MYTYIHVLNFDNKDQQICQNNEKGYIQYIGVLILHKDIFLKLFGRKCWTNTSLRHLIFNIMLPECNYLNIHMCSIGLDMHF